MPDELHAVAAVVRDQLLVHARSSCGCGCGKARSSGRGCRSRPGAARHRFGGSARLSCHSTTSLRGVDRQVKPSTCSRPSGRAVEQPRVLCAVARSRRSRNGRSPSGRGAVAAQVDRSCAVRAQHGPGAVRDRRWSAASRDRRRRRRPSGRTGPGALGVGQVADPGGQPAAVAVVLGQQDLVARSGRASPGSGAAPAARPRLPGWERRRGAEPHDAVAVLGRGVTGSPPSSASTQNRRRRRPLLPGHPARAGRHAALAVGTSSLERQVGDHALQLAAWPTTPRRCAAKYWKGPGTRTAAAGGAPAGARRPGSR